MLPISIPTLGAALLLLNPFVRVRTRRAKAHGRILSKMTAAARRNKRSKGAYRAFHQSLLAQAMASKAGLKRLRSSAAVQYGIRAGSRKNPAPHGREGLAGLVWMLKAMNHLKKRGLQLRDKLARISFASTLLDLRAQGWSPAAAVAKASMFVNPRRCR